MVYVCKQSSTPPPSVSVTHSSSWRCCQSCAHRVCSIRSLLSTAPGTSGLSGRVSGWGPSAEEASQSAIRAECRAAQRLARAAVRVSGKGAGGVCEGGTHDTTGGHGMAYR